MPDKKTGCCWAETYKQTEGNMLFKNKPDAIPPILSNLPVTDDPKTWETHYNEVCGSLGIWNTVTHEAGHIIQYLTMCRAINTKPAIIKVYCDKVRFGRIEVFNKYDETEYAKMMIAGNVASFIDLSPFNDMTVKQWMDDAIELYTGTDGTDEKEVYDICQLYGINILSLFYDVYRNLTRQRELLCYVARKIFFKHPQWSLKDIDKPDELWAHWNLRKAA